MSWDEAAPVFRGRLRAPLTKGGFGGRIWVVVVTMTFAPLAASSLARIYMAEVLPPPPTKEMIRPPGRLRRPGVGPGGKGAGRILQPQSLVKAWAVEKLPDHPGRLPPAVRGDLQAADQGMRLNPVQKRGGAFLDYPDDAVGAIQ